MSWLIPDWGKKTVSGLRYLVYMVLAVILVFSPTIVYVVLIRFINIYKYSMERAITYTAIYTLCLLAFASLLMIREFMKAIRKVRRDLFYLTHKDRINKEDIYNLLDEYDVGWRDRR